MAAALIRLYAAALFFLPLATPDTRAAEPGALWAALARGGHVAMIRHATAPGTGDPANFKIGDCSTQRNLDETGRNQARRAGDAFRANDVTAGRVLSSEWCRCQETARLLGLGEVQPLSALNSLHARQENEPVQARAFKAFLATLPQDGPSVVFVSHHATIGAFTGVYPTSGGIVVLALTGNGGFEVAGSIPPP